MVFGVRTFRKDCGTATLWGGKRKRRYRTGSCPTRSTFTSRPVLFVTVGCETRGPQREQSGQGRVRTPRNRPTSTVVRGRDEKRLEWCPWDETRSPTTPHLDPSSPPLLLLLFTFSRWSVPLKQVDYYTLALILTEVSLTKKRVNFRPEGGKYRYGVGLMRTRWTRQHHKDKGLVCGGGGEFR